MSPAKLREPSFVRILLLLAGIMAAGVLVLGITQDRNVAEKIGTALMMPSGMLWILLLTLSIHLWRSHRRQRSGISSPLAATVCFLLFSIAGNGFVADRMAALLEANYVKINPLHEAPLDVVIVLGGGGAPGANGRQQGNSSGDRLILAAQLYHQQITGKFICTGQRIALMNASGVDPAVTSREVLVKLGVPESAIEMASGRNTSEEMQNLGTRFQGSNSRIGLLTSAWHLPRAMRLARRNGLQTIPLPADFRSSPETDQKMTVGQLVESIIPTGYALGSTWQLAKEFVGILIGR